jgi:hypothetical protein
MVSAHQARRTFLTLLAQGLSSLTNFLISALALAAGGLEAFGDYSIVFQACIIVVAVGQGSTGISMLIHRSQAGSDEEGEKLEQGVAGATLIVAALCAIPLSIAALATDNALRVMFVMATFGTAGLASQYTLREIRFAKQDQAGVVTADLVWLGIVLIAAGLDHLLGVDMDERHYLGAWLLGAGISAWPLIRRGLRASREQVQHFWSVAGIQSVKVGVDSLLARSILIVTLIFADQISGPVASGSIAAAFLVFSPMSVTNISATALVVPDQIARHGVHVVRRLVPALTAAAVMGITAMWALAVLILDGTGLAFGPFDLAANNITIGLFTATLLHFLALGFWRGSIVALRIADAANESLAVRLRATVVQWGLPPIGFYLFATIGGAVGLAIATWIGALLNWRRYTGLRD